MTPEGKIKKLVSEVLRDVPDLYYWMPVPSGYGDATLDYVGSYRGRFFAIETKAPGKKPTPRQQITIERMQRGGAAVFIIDSTDLTELLNWLTATTAKGIS